MDYKWTLPQQQLSRKQAQTVNTPLKRSMNSLLTTEYSTELPSSLSLGT